MISGNGILCHCETCHGVEVSKMMIHFMFQYHLKYHALVFFFFGLFCFLAGSRL